MAHQNARALMVIMQCQALAYGAAPCYGYLGPATHLATAGTAARSSAFRSLRTKMHRKRPGMMRARLAPAHVAAAQRRALRRDVHIIAASAARLGVRVKAPGP